MTKWSSREISIRALPGEGLGWGRRDRGEGRGVGDGVCGGRGSWG